MWRERGGGVEHEAWGSEEVGVGLERVGGKVGNENDQIMLLETLKELIKIMFKHSQAPPWHYSAVSAVQNHFIFSLNSSPKRQTSMSRWRQWEQCAGRSKNSAKLTALYCAFVTGLCPLRSVEKNPAMLITQLSHTGQLGYIYPLNLLLRLLFVSFC